MATKLPILKSQLGKPTYGSEGNYKAAAILELDDAGNWTLYTDDVCGTVTDGRDMLALNDLLKHTKEDIKLRIAKRIQRDA